MRRIVSILAIIIVGLLMSVSCSQKEDTVKPVASFILEQDEILLGEQVVVKNTSIDAIYYSWDFGDGFVSSDKEPVHTYEIVGTYTISLQAFNKAEKDVHTEQITVIEPQQGTITIIVTTPTNIKAFSATIGAQITNNSEETIAAKGFCWSTNSDPSLDNNLGTINEGGGNDNFESNITGLSSETIYFVCAYVTTNVKTYYSTVKVFTTNADESTSIPTISTSAVSDITSETAICGGNITNNGGLEIINRGVCYGTTQLPKTDSNPYTTDGNGVGVFISTIENLEPNTTYYIRAYATNSKGTAYGEQRTLKTLAYTTKYIEVSKTNVAPTIDGNIDAIWDNVEAFPIERTIREDKVSFTSEPYFKVLWDDEKLYILVEVPDDNFYPAYDAGVEEWLADRVAIYMDVNEIKVDGKGPSNPESGHYSLAPYFKTSGWYGIEFEYVVSNDASYLCEYAIEFATLFDGTGAFFNPNTRNEIGFDIEIADLDESGKGENETKGSAVWSNSAPTNDNWTSMDDAGDMVFLGIDDRIADFIGTPLVIDAGQSVSFKDLSSGDPQSYSWGFGDGGTSTESNPSYTFNTAGKWTVSLDVQYGDGTTKTISKPAYITVNDIAPTANFNVDNSSPYTNETVQFSDLSSGNPTSWSWDFGDGETSTESNPSHIYKVAGTYTVEVTVSNAAGPDTYTCTSCIVVSDITVPVANFSVDNSTPYTNEMVQFSDLSSGNPTSWSWDFGDGETSTESNPSHIYKVAGTYTVEVTVSNVAGPDTYTCTSCIVVSDLIAPVANFSVDNSTPYQGLPIMFIDESTGVVTDWYWDFGDGGTSTEQYPTHNYGEAGTYTAYLTVSNSAGSDTYTRTDYIVVSAVSGIAPTAEFTVDNNTPVVNNEIYFTDASSGEPTSWTWDFGNGGVSTAVNGAYAYTAAGTYNVKLTVTNLYGSDYSEQLITVTEASFSILIEAENYIDMNGVQIETGSESSGGSHVGYIDTAGDFMKYSDVDIPADGYYVFEVNVASGNSGTQSFYFGQGESNISGDLSFDQTGGWNMWTTISQEIYLTTGLNEIKLVYINGSFNVDWIKISSLSKK